MVNLANHSYVAKINPTKILPLNTKFIVPANMAGLLKYFYREPIQSLPVLPCPKGSFSEKVPSFSIELSKYTWQEDQTPRGNCGEYLSSTSAQKFLISKHAAEDGVIAMVGYYAKVFPHNLPNSPIFTLHGITVLVICQFITAKVSLCRYSPIFYPINILPCTVARWSVPSNW